MAYGEAQRKYYQKNKDKIYRKTLKYKKQYNKEYYSLHKEELLAKNKAWKRARKEKMLSEEAKKGSTVEEVIKNTEKPEIP